MKFWTNVAHNLFSPLPKTESAAQPQQAPSGGELPRRYTEPVRDSKRRQMSSMAKKLLSKFSSSKGGYQRSSSASQSYAYQPMRQTNPVLGPPRRTDSGYSGLEHLPPLAKPWPQPEQQPPSLRPAQYQFQATLAGPHTFPAAPAFPPDSGYGSQASSQARPQTGRQAQSGSAHSSLHFQPPAAAAPNVQRQTASFRPEQEIRNVENRVAQTLERDLGAARQSGLMPVQAFLAARDHCETAALNDLTARFNEGMRQLEHFLPQQKAERQQKLQADYEKAYARVLQTIDQGCRNHGFTLGNANGNVKWETPLLLKHGLDLSNLTLAKADNSAGTFGSVSIFKTDDQTQVAGKISKNNMRGREDKVIDDLGLELEAFRRVYQEVGPHPNLVNVYGIASVQKNGKTERAMLMDYIPGFDGNEAFQALRDCWKSGKISSSQYWGAMQLIARRLLDVSSHINEAGIAHRDNKPANLRINEETGEPILIDLGLWARHGKRGDAGTPGYMAPELSQQAGVDRNADTFSIGATMVDAIEGGHFRVVMNQDGKTTTELRPDAGLVRALEPAPQAPLVRQLFDVQNADGSWTRKGGAAMKDNDLIRFFEATMTLEREKRFDMAKAKKDLAILDTHEMSPEAALEVIKNAQVPAFLSDSLLDDDAAKEVLKNVLKMAKEENAKPKNQRWKVTQKQEKISSEREDETDTLLKNLLRKPDLATYGTLHNYSKTDKGLKAYLDGGLIEEVRSSLEREADSFATGLLAETDWFDAIDSAARSIKGLALPSNATGEADEKKEHDKQLSREAGRVRIEIGSLVSPAQLRQYADDAEVFLRNVDGLPGGVHNPRIAKKIEQVRQRATAAREVVKLLDAATPEPALDMGGLRRRLETSSELNKAFEKVNKQPVQTTELLHRMQTTPDLATYATLQALAGRDSRLKAELDQALTPAAISTMHRDTHNFIAGLLSAAPWFDAVDSATKNLPPSALRAGGANNPEVSRMRAEIANMTTVDEVRGYKQQIAALLRNYDALPGPRSPALEAGIAQLNYRVAVLTDVVELMRIR